MSGPPSGAPGELSAEVEAAIRGRVLATIDELGEEGVIWLAAAPLWTLGVAEAAGFPVRPVIDWVRRACGAGWCKTRGSLLGDAPPDLLFWMPDEVRREVADAMRDRLGGDRVTEDYARVVQRVDGVAARWILQQTLGPEAELTGDELPGALVAWAQLLVATPLARPPSAARDSGGRFHLPPGLRTGTEAGELLIARTQQAVAGRDLSLAQDLVAAGEAIAGVLAGGTEQALSRARRLLALGMRRRQDERALVRYLDRPELSDAVARLLNRDALAGEVPATAGADEPSEPPWALHLRGVGGVGKTMLIRYLASGRYAADRGLPPVPVARADFDRISPDYPVRRPVQLLLELADELALHAAASDRADQALTVFRTRAARAHEAVSGLREAGGSPLRNPEVALAVDRFGDVLAELGNVLLILDTCEELAKADLGNPATPAVRATLDIIERLHKRAPSARVLFAGRRPLPARRYLAVQPVAGFTVDEARRYLLASASRLLPPELAEEMIRQSAAVDGPVPAAGQLPDRVSPFDLALYAAWADEDPELDVAQVSRGSDAYVEGRIVERLNDPLVVGALPVLAAAGRCRLATIAPLLDCDPGVLGRRLAEQEWIDADGDPVTHVAARPTLASRLRRYFESDERRAEFAARTAALASALLDRARQASLAEIDVDELLAALRLAEPAAAAALWDSIADRATQPPGRWGTVLNLTRRVLGEWDEEEWPTTVALRATVTASHIAASRRDSALFEARGPWETVRAYAGRHPDPDAQRRLLARALLGLLPYTPDDQSLWRAFADAFPPRGAGAPAVEPAEQAAFADAEHRLLEAGRPDAAGDLDALLFNRTRHTERPGRRTEAWLEVVQARLVADGDSSLARHPLERAQVLAAGATGDEPSWPDWIPPDDLLARVRIESGLIAPPEDLTVLDAWESYAADRLDSIDGERLASLCLRIRLRHGIIDASVAERLEAADGYRPDRTPTCTAHDLVPPLFVSVAQAWMSAGEPEHALALLDRRRGAALGTRQDDLTARDADAAAAAIVRRLRLTDRQSLLQRLGSAGGYGHAGPTALGDTKPLAWRALAVVSPGSFTGLVPSLLTSPSRWHAWWQSQQPRALPDGGERPSDSASSPATSADIADIQADLDEIRQLGLLLLRSGFHGALGWENMISDWLEQLPSPPSPSARFAEPHREQRAAMRLAALAGESFELPPRTPPRMVAEMAFEEAELTALRLPEAASRLFHAAAVAYRVAGDPLGEYLARQSILITGHPADGPTATRPDVARELADEAHRALSRLMPRAAAMLEARPYSAGPWRNWTPTGQAETGWAQAVREAAELTAADPASAATPPGRPVAGSTSAAQEQRGALPADPRAASPSPPMAGPGSGAHRAGRSGPRIAVAALAACLIAGLGALGVSALHSEERPGTHPVTTTTAAAAPSSATASPPSASPSSVITSQAPPPATPPASTALATTEPAKHQAVPGGESPLPWIVAVIAGLAALAALLGWYLPKILRLARGQGVGVARLGTLVFNVRPDALAPLRLRADARPWRTAPWRARGTLWLFLPAAWLGRTRGDFGYSTKATASADSLRPESVQWDAPRPKASAAWWRRGRGSALGLIHDPGRAGNLELAAAPWERVLAGSLGPDAAGRIEWIRLVHADSVMAFATLVPQSMLLAPTAWARALSEYYKPPPRGIFLTGVLHVIGRAVATSAGPAMDVGVGVEASAGSGARQRVFSVTELMQFKPLMVILQAEPAASGTIGAGPPDDQAEKLRLGAALAADGALAVLLLPVLPAVIADEVARIITTHTGLRVGADADAQVLLTMLRTAVAPHVAPQVLDDIVLFLNVARYRS